jgi:predicted dehydrogenase
MPGPTRRAFAATLAGVSAYAQKAAKPGVAARSAARIVGANDRINVGCIGVGGMGTVHLTALIEQSEKAKDVRVAAISDVYKLRKEQARDAARLENKDVHHEYRDLLARDDIDAVVIATPDHWHAQIALDALASGKDVYLQKPMTYSLEEARSVTEAVAKYGRVLQVGSQGLSVPSVRKAREIIEQGEIGEVVWMQGTSSRNSTLGEWNWKIDPEGTPENIDWSRWLGSAPKRPFSAERYFRWRKYWDYSGGIATDLYYHTLAPLVYAAGLGFPSVVTACGGVYLQKDREVPDTYATQIEYPTCFVTLAGSMASEAGNRLHPLAIFGHKGTITFSADSVTVSPEILLPDSLQGRPPQPPAKTYQTPAPGDAHRAHMENFFSCVRSRKEPNLNAELGYRIMTAIRLGVDAYRERKAMVFDPKTQKVVERPPNREA